MAKRKIAQVATTDGASKVTVEFMDANKAKLIGSVKQSDHGLAQRNPTKAKQPAQCPVVIAPTELQSIPPA